MSGPSVLVVTDSSVKTGKGEAFHCLAKLTGVRCVSLAGSIEMCREQQAKGGWDVVVIDCKTLQGAYPIIKGIKDEHLARSMVVVHEGSLGDAKKDNFGIYAPKKEIDVRMAISQALGEMI